MSLPSHTYTHPKNCKVTYPAVYGPNSPHHTTSQSWSRTSHQPHNINRIARSGEVSLLITIIGEKKRNQVHQTQKLRKKWKGYCASQEPIAPCTKKNSVDCLPSAVCRLPFPLVGEKTNTPILSSPYLQSARNARVAATLLSFIRPTDAPVVHCHGSRPPSV